MTAPILTNIPQELKDRDQWVTWKYTGRPDPTTGKRKKLLIDPHTGRAAQSNNPQTWASFADALAAYGTGGYNGLGYVFDASDPYTGVDLDGCLDQAGAIAPWAARIVADLASYTERSPSGTGLHIIVRGVLPASFTDKAAGVEAYSQRRYFTMTGDHLAGAPVAINDAQAALSALYSQFKPAKHHTASAYTGPTASASDPYVQAWAQRKIDRALDEMRQAGAGTRHHTRYNVGRLLGGLVAHGLLSAQLAADLIYQAQPPTTNDASERKAIMAGIAAGARAPLQLPPPRVSVVPLEIGGGVYCPDHLAELRPAKHGGYYCPAPDTTTCSGYCGCWWDGTTPPAPMGQQTAAGSPQGPPAAGGVNWTWGQQSAPPPPGNPQDVTVDQRYLSGDASTPAAPMPATRVVLVDSAMNTGKTHHAAQYTPAPAPLRSVTHRRSLAREQANRLDADLYSDYEGALDSHERLVITPHSMHRLTAVLPGAIVFMDESQQLLSDIALSRLLTSTQRRQALTDLVAQLRVSKQIICADAHMGFVTRNFFQRIGFQPDEIATLKNLYRPGGHTYLMYEHPEDVLLQMQADLKAGKRCYLAINSTKQPHAIVERIARQLGIDGLAISSTNSDDPEIRRILGNFDAAVQDYQLVAVSPTVGTGVDQHTPHFHAVYLLAWGDVATHYDLMQMAGRIRKPIDGLVHCWVDKRRFSHEESPATIRRHLLESYWETGVEIKRDPATGAIIGAVDDLHLDLVADVTAYQNASKNRLKDNFKAAVLLDRHTLGTGHAYTDAERRAERQTIKAIKDEIADAWYADVIDAPELSEDEYALLAAQDTLTADEKAQIHKADVATCYDLAPAEITPELLRLHDDGLAGWRQIDAHIEHRDLALSHDTGHAADLIGDQKNATLTRDLLCTLLDMIIKGGVAALAGPVAPEVDVQVAQLTAYLLDGLNRDDIARLLKKHIKVVTPQTVRRFAGDLIEWLGHKTLVKRNKKTGQRSYRLDPERWAIIRTFSTAHADRTRARLAIDADPLSVAMRPSKPATATSAPFAPSAPQPPTPAQTAAAPVSGPQGAPMAPQAPQAPAPPPHAAPSWAPAHLAGLDWHQLISNYTAGHTHAISVHCSIRRADTGDVLDLLAAHAGQPSGGTEPCLS